MADDDDAPPAAPATADGDAPPPAPATADDDPPPPAPATADDPPPAAPATADDPHPPATTTTSSTAVKSSSTPSPPSPAAPTTDESKHVDTSDEKSLKQLVEDCNWSGIEKRLKKILSLEQKGQDHARIHPYLFLPVYDEWMTGLIREKEISEASKVFAGKVAGIYYAEGEFVDQDLVKAEVNRLHLVVTEEAEIPAVPTSAEKMFTILSDYLDLYFPDRTGHNIACEGYNHIWRFAKRLEKPKKQKHPNIRCLACGAVFKNCTISKMRIHLSDEEGRICPKLTANIRRRFNDGENEKGSQNQGALYEGHGKSVRPSKQFEKGGMVKQNPPVEEQTENINSLANAVHTSVQSLHAIAMGKNLDPEVRACLKIAKDMLNELVP